MRKLLLSVATLAALIYIGQTIGCGGGGSGSSSGSDTTTVTEPGSQPTPEPTPIKPIIHIQPVTKNLVNYGVVLANQLSRSGQPTQVGLADIGNSSIDIIVKLNMDVELGTVKSNDEAKFSGKQVMYRPLNFLGAALSCSDASATADMIWEQIVAGKWVLVHCTRGVDRTELIIGYLKMRYMGQTYAQIQADWGVYGRPADNVIACLQNFK